jgi:DNA-binding MarR family transcriptional regulator
MSLAQLETVEANLRRLHKSLPALPVTESLILRAAIIFGRDANALLVRLLKPAGLAEGEFRLLMSLFGRGGSAFAGDLCASLAQSPANLTRIGDALVERGYVSRDPDLTDRRRMLLTLLPEGERMLREMLPEVSAQFGALFEGFSRSEKTQLLVGLKKLLAGIDALDLREAQEDGAP